MRIDIEDQAAFAIIMVDEDANTKLVKHSKNVHLESFNCVIAYMWS